MCSQSKIIEAELYFYLVVLDFQLLYGKSPKWSGYYKGGDTSGSPIL